MARRNLREQVKPAWAACKSYVENWWFWILVALVLILLVVALIYAGYELSWTGLGEYSGSKPRDDRARTLWDWLELLLVPLLLAFGAWLLNRAAREREHKLELDRSRQAILQAYLDQVTALLRSTWRESAEGFLEANIIRTQTLTVLRQLDGERKGLLLQFLCESGLIGNGRGKEGAQEALVDLCGANLMEAKLYEADLSETNLEGANLRGADLSGADLRWANLGGTDLRGANLGRAYLRGVYLRGADLRGTKLHGVKLHEANLIWANLRGADLHGTDLRGADLTGAELNEADLRGADLTGAIVTDEQLTQAASLEGAALPDDRVRE